MDKAKQSGEWKGRVGDSHAKPIEPAQYFCCVAGCRISRRGRFFQHGSGKSQLFCCPVGAVSLICGGVEGTEAGSASFVKVC